MAVGLLSDMPIVVSNLQRTLSVDTELQVSLKTSESIFIILQEVDMGRIRPEVLRGQWKA